MFSWVRHRNRPQSPTQHHNRRQFSLIIVAGLESIPCRSRREESQSCEKSSGITAEVQKGHTYYRCSKKSKGVKCSQPFARAESLASQLEALLAAFTLRPDWADDMLRLIEAKERECAQSAQADRQEKQAEIAAIAAKLQKLLDAYA